jgi:LGFP repeat-containing protein
MQDDDVTPSIGGSQGVQIGLGNVQLNAWAPKTSLDPATLIALSPHAAVDRLQSLPHDERVNFFARANPEGVAEIFAAFLEVDEDRVVAALGDINRQKAAELIDTLSSADAVLKALPEAAHAIARRAASLKWAEAEPLEHLEEGYVRKYGAGRICWLESHGTHAITGEIEEYWADNRVALELAEEDQEVAPSSPFDTTGVRQKFQGLTVYSSKRGTYLVERTVEQCYADEGGSAGWLGFPVGEDKENEVHDFIQPFEGGIICSTYSPNEEAFAVRSEIEKALFSVRLFFPLSEEYDTADSLYDTSGRVQQFLVNRTASETGQRTAVYYSGDHPVMVDPEMWNYYSNDLDGEDSWLGFPTKPVRISRSGMRIQSFEGGVIYWRNEIGPVAVTNSTLDFIEHDREVRGKIGYPVSGQQVIGENYSGRIQFFDNGVITVRDGKHEIWIRPEVLKPASEPDDMAEIERILRKRGIAT